jgi:AraC-like DNA-binding protein
MHFLRYRLMIYKAGLRIAATMPQPLKFICTVPQQLENRYKCWIDRAKELLLFRQDCSIADVAFQVGFASQSQFTKHFKKWVGTTPKKF